ncbi:hypothetical protein ACIRQQ_27860 [Streptomyces fuscichromogenes]|uniref:hypothetical protein n=1 Tax=Streptomyces fuscichromogenes TaxID=1324013 RepID=UPI0038238E65
MPANLHAGAPARAAPTWPEEASRSADALTSATSSAPRELRSTAHPPRHQHEEGAGTADTDRRGTTRCSWLHLVFGSAVPRDGGRVTESLGPARREFPSAPQLTLPRREIA